MKHLAAAILVATVSVAPAHAACSVAGAKCIAPSERVQALKFPVGGTLPRGKFNVLLNTEYYGLPPTDGSFWYFKVERRVLKVRPDTMEVLDDVTRKASRAVW